MFFKNALIFLFLKFFWFGLIFGLIWLLCKLVIKVSKNNVYIFNIITFCFVLAFGVIYVWLCNSYYNYSFCWFGLLGMVLGIILVSISINFFFTIFAKLLYNKCIKRNLRGRKNGKLQSNQEG